MDRTIGEGYAIIDGKRQFVDGPPGTKITAQFLNALQEEIMAVIEGAGISPSADNLTQLKQAVTGYANSSSLRYGIDIGVVNAYVVDLNPAISAYADGFAMTFRPINSNTGAATINVNSVGIKSIVNMAGAALSAGDIRVGAIHLITYNSSSGNFQLNNKAN